MKRVSAVALATAAVALGALSLARAAGGDLDPTFGAGGSLATALGGRAFASALVIQPDGKLLVAGFSSGHPVLVRFTPEGRLDPGFGDGGRAPTVGTSLAVQRDGRIVVVGADVDSPVLVRHQPDGALDDSFGVGGTLRTGLGGIRLSVLVQPDGRIVKIGSTALAGKSRFALLRYRVDGRPDATFGTDGRVIEVEGLAWAAALAPGGKVVVVGTRFGATGRTEHALVARFTARGRLDRTFGRGGVVATRLSDGVEGPRAVAVQPDGKVLVAVLRSGSLVVTRYRANGSLDGGFGSAGTAFAPDALYSPRALAIDRRGRIVVAGNGPDLFEGFVVVRLTPRGRLDGRFGRSGVVRTELGRGADANALAIQSDGKIVAAGWRSATARSLAAPDSELVLVRYLPSTCVVPRLSGTTLVRARRALARAGCRAGRTTRAPSRRVARGRVIRQAPAPRTQMPDHMPVALVVSRG